MFRDIRTPVNGGADAIVFIVFVFLLFLLFYFWAWLPFELLQAAVEGDA